MGLWKLMLFVVLLFVVLFAWRLWRGVRRY